MVGTDLLNGDIGTQRSETGQRILVSKKTQVSVTCGMVFVFVYYNGEIERYVRLHCRLAFGRLLPCSMSRHGALPQRQFYSPNTLNAFNTDQIDQLTIPARRNHERGSSLHPSQKSFYCITVCQLKGPNFPKFQIRYCTVPAIVEFWGQVSEKPEKENFQNLLSKTTDLLRSFQYPTKPTKNGVRRETKKFSRSVERSRIHNLDAREHTPSVGRVERHLVGTFPSCLKFL